VASLIVRRDAWRKANLPTSTTQLETSYGVTTTSSDLGTAVDGRIEANAAKSGEDPTLSNKVAASSSPATVPSHHTLQQTGRVWGRNRVAFRSPSRTLQSISSMLPRRIPSRSRLLSNQRSSLNWFRLSSAGPTMVERMSLI
jgi:hypothetical protein